MFLLQKVRCKTEAIAELFDVDVLHVAWPIVENTE